MEKLLKLLTVLLMLSFLGCSEDDPDPRTSFEDTFEAEDFDVSVTNTSRELDTVITISDNPEVEFERDDEELNGDELSLDVEELVDDVIQGTIAEFYPEEQFSTSYDDEFIVEVTGNEFDVDDTNFFIIFNEGSSSGEFLCEFNGDGELDGDEISLDFDIILYAVGAGNFNFTGTVTGERD